MLNYPVHIGFELTNVCNLDCVMCPHGIMKRPQGFFDKELFKKVVDETEGRVKTSYLHQIGEPLLYPDVVELVNYAAAAGIRTSLSTNCILLDETMIEKILNSSLAEITLCLDSLDKENYERIRKGGDFDKVIGNIQSFLAKRRKEQSTIHTQIQMIKMKENENEWDKFKKLFGSENIEILVKEYSSFAGKVLKEENPEPMRFSCNKMNTHITIHWNGDVVPCCRDFEGLEIMGNIKDKSISEIWGSDKYNDFRKNYLNKELCRCC